MGDRQHEEQRVLAQFGEADVVRIRRFRRAYETQVHRPARDRFQLMQCGHFVQGQGDVRELLAVAVDDGGEVGRKRRGKRKADAQLARFAPLRPARRDGRLFRQGQDAPRIVEEQRTRLRQAHGALVALEQLRAQFRFQRLDLLAQRRLADVQALGRAREVQFLGDGDKVTQVAQFHVRPVIVLKYELGLKYILDDMSWQS